MAATKEDAQRAISSFLNLLPLLPEKESSQRRVHEDTFSRAVNFAETCDTSRLCATIRELGEYHHSLDETLSDMVDGGQLKESDSDIILDRWGDFEDIVDQAIAEALTESCQCKLR